MLYSFAVRMYLTRLEIQFSRLFGFSNFQVSAKLNFETCDIHPKTAKWYTLPYFGQFKNGAVDSTLMYFRINYTIAYVSYCFLCERQTV